MPTPDRIARFLSACGWDNALRKPLAGDASRRRYERLTDDTKGVAVLMDAPPGSGEDTRPFLDIADYLHGLDLSAPRIIAADEDQGLILLEDLGDDLYARVLEAGRADEISLYIAATDVLLRLQSAEPPAGLAAYDADAMTKLAGLATEWYAPEADGAPLLSALHAKLLEVWPTQPVTVLRDYHAENLLWLPQRPGTERVGLLDFQDAMLGHPVYDLVSLVQDARRDVGEDASSAALAHFSEHTAASQDELAFWTSVIGAQRALRILGVFARLSRRDEKPGYLEFVPRVWRDLQTCLQHPSMAEVAQAARALPAPSESYLERLKSQAAP